MKHFLLGLMALFFMTALANENLLGESTYNVKDYGAVGGRINIG